MPFILIFIVVPLIELMVFARVSSVIGIGSALLFALLTAIIGGTLVRRQGLKTLAALQQSMGVGRMPLDHIFDGFCLIAAGAMLITPGFITDAFGFALLTPVVRDMLRRFIKDKTNWAAHVSKEAPTQTQTDVIEGEYEHLDE